MGESNSEQLMKERRVLVKIYNLFYLPGDMIKELAAGTLMGFSQDQGMCGWQGTEGKGGYLVLQAPLLTPHASRHKANPC